MDTVGNTYSVPAFSLAATSRQTVTPSDAGIVTVMDIAATVTSTNGVGIVAERPIYFNGGNAGHNTIGVSQN